MSATLEEFIKHAEKFGAECVFEVASSNGFSERELLQLRIELDAIEAARKGIRFTVGTRRRRAPAETVEAVLALAHEGLVVSAIADKLGVTDAYIRRCLKAENGLANPHDRRAKVALSSEPG